MSHTDREALISLPYRIGLYISRSDLSGGAVAEDAELKVLRAILMEVSEDFCKSEFTQKIILETSANKDKWKEWSGNAGQSVLTDCRHLVDSLTFLIDKYDLNSLKEILVDIAVAVAMAFHEGGAVPKQTSGLDRFLGMFTGKKRSAHFANINISVAERKALQQLCAALNWTYKA